MRLFTVCGLVLAGACAAESPDATTIVATPLATMEDTPVTFTLDVTGAYTTAGILQPSHGYATIDGLVVTYTPESNFFGADVFRAYVTMDGSFAETALDIVVVSVNDAPIGSPDTFTAVEDTPFTIPAEMLLANDIDVEGEPVTLASVGNAANGIVSLAQGNVTFVPDANFFGTTTFDYVTTDGTDSSSTTVELYVANTNDPPIAVADTATVATNTPLQLYAATLLANDYDADGVGSLSLVDVTNCVNCVISTTPMSPGNIRIFPAQDFTGTASVDYSLTDGIATATATVTITVTP